MRGKSIWIISTSDFSLPPRGEGGEDARPCSLLPFACSSRSFSPLGGVDPDTFLKVSESSPSLECWRDESSSTGLPSFCAVMMINKGGTVREKYWKLYEIHKNSGETYHL